MDLRRFIPPIVRAAVQRGNHRWRFASYEDAFLACPSNGYQDARLIDVVAQKTERFRDGVRMTPIKDGAISAALRPVGKCRHLSVVDFGGALGAHYFTAKALHPEMQFTWSVIETSGMVNCGRSRFENEELRFFESIHDLATPDLVFSSGAIQCVPDVYETLASLVDLGATAMFVARLDLTNGQEIVYLEESLLSTHGPGPLPQGMSDGTTRYPLTIACRRKVEEILTTRYSVISQCEASYTCLVPDCAGLGPAAIRDRARPTPHNSEFLSVPLVVDRVIKT